MVLHDAPASCRSSISCTAMSNMRTRCCCCLGCAHVRQPRFEGARELHLWEFIHSPSSVREHWRWRRKDSLRNILLESAGFTLFLSCLADAREHGFDMAAHEFRVVSHTLPTY